MTTYPNAAWKPVPNHGGPMVANYGLVLHVQVGNGGLQGWFSNPNSQVSSTFWVSKTGVVEQYVDCDVVAWAQGQGNSTYNSIESEGYPEEPLTDAAINSIAHLYAWGNREYGWPNVFAESPGQKGFGWHGMGGSAWGNHPSCPGDIRKNQRSQILQLAFGGIPTIPPSTPQPPQTSKAPAMHVDYFGPAYGHNYMCQDVWVWQNQMLHRGWSIDVDNIFGPKSEHICRQFQLEKGLTHDGLVGPQTWKASWDAPIT